MENQNMIGSVSNRRVVSICTAVALGFAAAPMGCGGPGGRDVLGAKAEVVDHSTHALTSGSLQWIDGTYATCFGHTDGDPWSLRIAGATSMTNAALTVTKDDPTCQLTVAALMASVIYEPNPRITMSTAYQATASTFASRIAGVLQPVSFYANAKLSAIDFANDFTVTILYSDDPRNATASTGATYQQFTGSATTTQVPAPDYTSGFGSLVVQADALDEVSTATGSMDLVPGSHLGEGYVVVAGTVGATFAAVDAAYAAGTKVAIATSIAAASFLTAGDQLPATRAVIISHTVSGVVAYEAVQITFNHP
jgi:hypothetical protein